jgi:hypothetical protein
MLMINEVTGKAHMRHDECWYCEPCEKDAVTVNIPYLLN